MKAATICHLSLFDEAIFEGQGSTKHGVVELKCAMNTHSALSAMRRDLVLGRQGTAGGRRTLRTQGF